MSINQRAKDMGVSDLVKRIEKLEEENKKLKEDIDYFRQCYFSLKKMCKKEGFLASDEEIDKIFNLN